MTELLQSTLEHISLQVESKAGKIDFQNLLINPEIVEKSGEFVGEEGCLSIPGYRAKVSRFEKVKVTALDRTGKAIEIETDEFLAIVLQHEIDHLHGKVFIEHLSMLKQQIALKKVRKYA